MTQIDEFNKWYNRRFSNRDSEGIIHGKEDMRESYESARAPRTITRAELEQVINALEKEISQIPLGEECIKRGASKYNWGRYWLERVKHHATLGITVEW